MIFDRGSKTKFQEHDTEISNAALEAVDIVARCGVVA